MGELLLKGWKMLAETWFEWYCPLMQSKQGVKLCCGWDRDYSKPAPVKANESKANKTIDIKERYEDTSLFYIIKFNLLFS